MLKKKKVKICLGSSCFSRGNNEMVSLVQRYIRINQLEDKVEFSGDHCCNECLEGPTIKIEGKSFHKISTETIEQILKQELSE